MLNEWTPAARICGASVPSSSRFAERDCFVRIARLDCRLASQNFSSFEKKIAARGTRVSLSVFVSYADWLIFRCVQLAKVNQRQKSLNSWSHALKTLLQTMETCLLGLEPKSEADVVHVDFLHPHYSYSLYLQFTWLISRAMRLKSRAPAHRHGFCMRAGRGVASRKLSRHRHAQCFLALCPHQHTHMQ
jgi:hypothetical protein